MRHPQDGITPWLDRLFAADVTEQGGFTSVTTGNSAACWIETDLTVTCWGEAARAWDDEPPSGIFTAIEVEPGGGCALSTSGEIKCWGDQTDAPDFDAPQGEFESFATFTHAGCGVTTDHALSCWGDNDQGQTDAPDVRTSSDPGVVDYVTDLESERAALLSAPICEIHELPWSMQMTVPATRGATYTVSCTAFDSNGHKSITPDVSKMTTIKF